MFIKISFAKPKVCDLNVAIIVDQNIFWFQVPIYDLGCMQIFQSKNSLSKIELCYMFLETSLLLEMEEQFTSWAKIQNEVVVTLSFEVVMHFDDLRMIRSAKDLFFNVYLFFLLLIVYELLLDALHRIQLSIN